MFKFTLKIDDEQHSLSAKDGLPVDVLATLLHDLFEVINPKNGTKCTLGAIRGNCYALDLYSEDESFHTNFIVTHKRIEQHSEIDLKEKERKYASTLGVILGKRFYLQAFDNEGQEIAKIRSLDIKKEVKHFYVSKTVSGIVSELGAKDINIKPHIFISGNDYKVYINDEQDLALKPFYKTDVLQLRVRQKISIKDGHVISANLLSFRSKSGKLIDNIKNFDVSTLRVLKDINTSDDILRNRYGN